MSNRVDFYQSTQNQLAITAAGVSVLIEGTLCSCLEVIEIVRGGWPEFGWARLAYNPAADEAGDLSAAEEVESILGTGKAVCIRQVYNFGAPGASACGIAIFEGQIEAIETKLGTGGERVEVIVRDFSANLSRTTVYGRWVGNADGSVLFLPGFDTAFNDDSQPNATKELIEDDGSSLRLFAAESSKAVLWDYAEVINYLLCRYLANGQLHRPSTAQLRALTKGQKVRDLDVTGLSLLKALHGCCERIGLKFKFVPVPMPSGPRQAVVFYDDCCGRLVELNCQPGGQQLSISKTDIASLHSSRSFWPVTHRHVGQGDFKVYEATFDLVKAWPGGDEDTDYDKFSPSTNPDFYQVKDVFRKWCLNEAGDYSGAPYNQGEAFDFSRIFDSSNFTRRRRRFWPSLTTDKQGKSLGYFLQVSFDDGLHWWQYLNAFSTLADECGVWFSSDQLDFNTWVAALKGVLKFRITASVVSDERLSCVVADGPVNSVVPVVDHIITLPRWFKYRKVSGRSIFANVCDDSLGSPDEVDDSTALFEFTRHRAMMSPETVENIDVQTPSLAFDYRVGDRVTSGPESRDLLGCKGDNRSTYWIERVRMDFKNQCTNLRIIRQRKPQL